MWLSLTPIGIIHQNFKQIRSTTTDFLILSHFARAAACLLLAAKRGRSTLDPKKGYKTKTGSTSSVTLTLIPPPSPLAGRPPDPRPAPPPPTPGRNTPPPDSWQDPPPTLGWTPPQVLTDSWGGGVASGPVVVAPPPWVSAFMLWSCRGSLCHMNRMPASKNCFEYSALNMFE